MLTKGEGPTHPHGEAVQHGWCMRSPTTVVRSTLVKQRGDQRLRLRNTGMHV